MAGVATRVASLVENDALVGLRGGARGDGRGARAFTANPFLSVAPPPPAYLAWCVLWIAGILGAAVLSFRRREL